MQEHGRLAERIRTWTWAESQGGRRSYHEVGHLYGLGHCRNPKCVMRTCTCLPEVDEAGNDLCAACRKNLEKVRKTINCD
ncbi:MAG: hypothetical protein IMZ53_06205 [Thermoplasmata archaeon]|nr:hypothetical protein [Candidatus Atribacteria bacterium]MBE3140158.1 hypothetical protein [Thermoplasmata archaeon]